MATVNSQIIDQLVEQEGIQRVDLDELGFIDPEVLSLIPEDVAVKFKVIPFSADDKTLSITMANPFDIYAQRAISQNKNYVIKIHFTPKQQLDEWLGKLYTQNSGFVDDDELDEDDELDDEGAP